MHPLVYALFGIFGLMIVTNVLGLAFGLGFIIADIAHDHPRRLLWGMATGIIALAGLFILWRLMYTAPVIVSALALLLSLAALAYLIRVAARS